MMNVNHQSHFRIYKIHIVDQNERNILESKYLNFETKEAMYKKWQELIRENHYSLDMISQEIQTVTAFH